MIITNKSMIGGREQRGFTIVELLIVIVVIGVLAAIIIVAYNGITKRATLASMQSDLTNAAKVLENDKTLATDGSYPATLEAANDNKGIKASNGNAYQYTVDNGVNPKVYGLTITNGLVSYYIDQSGVIKEGVYSGHVAPADNTAVVTTLAGSGVFGFADGAGATAQFSTPGGMTFDASGNLYVADYYNNRIRKITPAGAVSTVAGMQGGYLDGQGTAARFNGPSGVAIDASGTIYVADSNNNRIRKITTSGDVSLFSGTGVSGCTEGSPTVARYNTPSDLVIDSAGNLYVVNTGCSNIIKITPSGTATRIAGLNSGFADGTGTGAAFEWPIGISIDASNVLYVADAHNNRIRTVTTTGVVGTVAGSTRGYKNDTGTLAQFYEPSDVVATANGNIYVVDSGNNRIRKIASSGVVTTVAGSITGFQDGIGTSAYFNRPDSIAVFGNVLYVSDNNRIRKVQLP